VKIEKENDAQKAIEALEPKIVDTEKPTKKPQHQ
jgi:hypothetical protein